MFELGDQPWRVLQVDRDDLVDFIAQHLAHKEAGQIARDRVVIAWDAQ